jgi:hypothetical protein
LYQKSYRRGMAYQKAIVMAGMFMYNIFVALALLRAAAEIAPGGYVDLPRRRGKYRVK